MSFSITKVFGLMRPVWKHSMSSMDFEATPIVQEKFANFELGHHNQVLDEYAATLKCVLENYVHISIFVTIYYT